MIDAFAADPAPCFVSGMLEADCAGRSAEPGRSGTEEASETAMMTSWTNTDYTRERATASRYVETDLESNYSLDRMGNVRFKHTIVKGADPETFRWFLPGFAKDRKTCYVVGQRLAGSDPSTFVMLNNCFAKDKNNVWCLEGRIGTADAGTFEVLDDGIAWLDDLPLPHGYAKDRAAVYYASFGDKAIVVKGADPKAFVSFGGGRFGKDDARVYTAGRLIPKADAATWRPLAAAYSVDARRVFFQRNVLKGADPATFEVLITGENATRVAKDRSRFYLHDSEISAAEYEQYATNSKSWRHATVR